MTEERKRKWDGEGGRAQSKKSKGARWRGHWKEKGGSGPKPTEIEPGDAGIWATCDKGREAKCVGELRDLFNQYADKLYASTQTESKVNAQFDEDEEEDIEAAIRKEVQGIQSSRTDSHFQSVKLDTPCLIFFKTKAPVEPVALVRQICRDTAAQSAEKRCRTALRLTPVSQVGKATPEGLAEVARAVLAPHFHQHDQSGKKFAIRPTIRNHTTLNREGIIQQVAATVGPGHRVDLKHYDLLILVSVYKQTCGISVVGDDYDQLKRYNLAELYEPSQGTPRMAAE